MSGTEKRAQAPSQEAVAWRAVSLHALVIRAELDYAYQLLPDSQAPEVAGLAPRLKLLSAWMEEQQVYPHLSAQERAVFGTPLGEWREADVLELSWRKESLGVLLWALSCLPELPPCDQEFPDQVHLEQIGWLLPVVDFLARAHLRPLEEIAAAREVTDLWLWRERAARLQQEQPRLAHRYNFPRLLREATARAHADGKLSPPIAGDFPALGKSYARLDDPDRALVQTITRERHFTLGWLCGLAGDWDEAPKET